MNRLLLLLRVLVLVLLVEARNGKGAKKTGGNKKADKSRDGPAPVATRRTVRAKVPAPVWTHFPPIGDEQELQFTGKTGKLRHPEIQDPSWSHHARLIRPFDSDHHRLPPVGYGQICANFKDLFPNEHNQTIAGALRFAIEEGLFNQPLIERFSSPTAAAVIAEVTSIKNEDESEKEQVCPWMNPPASTYISSYMVSSSTNRPSIIKVLAARQLDLVIGDGPSCEASVSEMAYRSYGGDQQGSLLKFWLKPQAGTIFYLLLLHEWTGAIHRLAVSLDHERDGSLYYSLLQHTYQPPPPSSVMAAPNQEPMLLRVLTYNIWHNNPPMYLYPEPNDRWRRYVKRMRHLASIINESQAHIIGFQEVRFDGFFGPATYHSQLQHLVDLLNHRQSSSPPYQFIYQPAMAFQRGIDGHSIRKIREEEGLAILSRYPIVGNDYIILPRNFTDPQDDHTRICMHAEILVPGLGLVDVYVTHLSLSERMREKSTVAILEYARLGRGEVQVLLGDLNAESHERSVQILKGKAEVEGNDTIGAFYFQDIWEDFYAEPSPNSQDEWDRYEALTFPSCNPVKRIDFVMYHHHRHRHRNASDHKDGGGDSRPLFEATAVGLLGQDPTEDTKHHKSEGGGMLDADSPCWASDHRGVFANFLYRRPP